MAPVGTVGYDPHFLALGGRKYGGVLGVGRYLCCLTLVVCWGCTSVPSASSPDAVKRAEALLRAGEADEARQVLEAMGARDALAEVVLADVWRCLGREERAIATYWQVRETTEPAIRSRANTALGEIALGRDDVYLARVRLDEACADAQDPLTRARARVGRARVAIALNDLATARRLRGEIGDLTVPGLEVLDAELAARTAPVAGSEQSDEAPDSARKGLARVPPRRVLIPEPGVLRRAIWSARPVRARGDPEPMGPVTRLTLHHTATKRLPGTSRSSNAQLLRSLQSDHQVGRRWADLGYHYVIDRQGRIWEGREMRWQGAHAGNGAANRHNVGIALVGDFDRYQPSAAQKRSLESMVRWLCARYDIHSSRIQGHAQVLKAFTGGGTACPGRHLQTCLGPLRRAVDRDRRAAAGL